MNRQSLTGAWLSLPFAIALLAAGPAPGASATAADIDGSPGAGGGAATSAAGAGDEITVNGRRTSTIVQKNSEFDDYRGKALLPEFGSTSYAIDEEALANLPQGANTPLDKVLLQAPGVSSDSAISNPSFHVRNEYANVQYRLNGIQLPDGVSALGPVLETGFVGRLNLLDGVLPAQYGQRTAGVVDIQTRTRFEAGGSVDVYGGTWSTISPSIEVGGESGNTQYFLAGRYLASDQGLENAMPTRDPVHDRTEQAKLFGYGSTLVGDSSRLTYMVGGFAGRFEIPNVAGQMTLGVYGPPTLSSLDINERETDRFAFGVLALQTHTDQSDSQLSGYLRYATVDFASDHLYDLAFNGVASDVTRKSLLGGLQWDSALRLGHDHTARFGLMLNTERTHVENQSLVLPLDDNGNPLPTPVGVIDANSKDGWTVGGYLQDEWRFAPALTLNAGLRFDAMNQFVAASQLSPRLALLYDPASTTHLHAGLARYFTPPMQAQATPSNLDLFANTTQAQAIPLADPVRPERASYVDVGVEQVLAPGLSAGVDTYYKRSTDTLDDGQFGQAVVLQQYNFAHGFARGVELKVSYVREGLRAYANYSHAISKVKDVVSKQYVIGDPVQLAYLAANYVYASDAQTDTASAGVAYRFGTALVSLDGLYGSGLRAGFANLQHSPGYAQWNAAIGRDFRPFGERQPLTVRVSAINVFDRVYVLRSGTGIGEYAPQYGPRRGLFLELTQQF